MRIEKVAGAQTYPDRELEVLDGRPLFIDETSVVNIVTIETDFLISNVFTARNAG